MTYFTSELMARPRAAAERATLFAQVVQTRQVTTIVVGNQTVELPEPRRPRGVFRGHGEARAWARP